MAQGKCSSLKQMQKLNKDPDSNSNYHEEGEHDELKIFGFPYKSRIE